MMEWNAKETAILIAQLKQLATAQIDDHSLAHDAVAALAAKDAEIERLRELIPVECCMGCDPHCAQGCLLVRQHAQRTDKEKLTDQLFTTQQRNEHLTIQLAEARRALAAYETPEGVAMLMERQGWKHGEILALLALLYCATDASRMNGEMAVDLMRDAFSKAEKAMPLAMIEAQAQKGGA